MVIRYIVSRITVTLGIFFLSCALFTYATIPQIIVAGKGGDYRGALLLQQQLKHQGQPVNVTLLDNGILLALQKQCTTHHNASVLFLGLGSINALIANINIASALVHQCRLGFYTHLLSQSLVQFLAEPAQASTPQLFTLLSEKERYRSTLEHNHNIKAFPLVIQTVARNDKIKQDSIQTTPSVAIWLGGDYIDGEGNKVVISNTQFQHAMEKINQQLLPAQNLSTHSLPAPTLLTTSLPTKNPPAKNQKIVAILLSPRTLPQNINSGSVVRRLQIINKPFKKNGYNVVFYLHPSQSKYQSKLTKNRLTSLISPDYAELIQLFTHQADVKHFITVDQFNIFTDLLPLTAHPVLLNPQDSAQSAFSILYQTLNKGSKSDATFPNQQMMNFLSTGVNRVVTAIHHN